MTITSTLVTRVKLAKDVEMHADTDASNEEEYDDEGTEEVRLPSVQIELSEETSTTPEASSPGVMEDNPRKRGRAIVELHR